MKVKSLVKTFRNVEFSVLAPSGWLIHEDYISNKYYDEAEATDWGEKQVNYISTQGEHIYIYTK